MNSFNTKIVLVKPRMVCFYSKVIVGYLNQNEYTEIDQITNGVIYQSKISSRGVSISSVCTPTNNVDILVSRESCALKFSIYIPQTIGKNFIPNLLFCDVLHFIGNLTPLWDLDCDSTTRSWSGTNCLVKDKYLHSITVTAIGALGWTGILLRKYSDQYSYLMIVMLKIKTAITIC